MVVLLDLRLELDVQRNLIECTGARLTRATTRGLGDAERELSAVGVETSRPTEEGEGKTIDPGRAAAVATADAPPAAAAAPEKAAAPPGNVFGPPPKKDTRGAERGALLTDLAAIGLDDTQVDDVLKRFSLDRLRKLVQWVRSVQAREGVTNPASLFLRCLSKGVQ